MNAMPVKKMTELKKKVKCVMEERWIPSEWEEMKVEADERL